MKRKLISYIILAIGLNLTGCSSTSTHHPEMSMNNQTVNTENNMAAQPENKLSFNDNVAGKFDGSMDVNDKVKLSRALDKAIGKKTKWVNNNTGIEYTVMPTQKVVLEGNPYCRKYTITATKNDNTREVNRTACVSATDSNWKAVD